MLTRCRLMKPERGRQGGVLAESRVRLLTLEGKGVGSTCSEDLLHESSKPQNISSPRKGEVRMSGPPSSRWISMFIGIDEPRSRRQVRTASYRDKFL